MRSVRNHPDMLFLVTVIVILSFASTSQVLAGNDRRERPTPNATAEDGRWIFRSEPDTFSEDALFDLRSLNEKEAGEKGFVTRSKDGNDFLLGDGTPARFWALNSSAVGKRNLDAEHHARFLAKRGVNLVHLHCSLASTGNDLNAVNEKDRDHIWKSVAAYKKAGIYTIFSPYWAGATKLKPSMGFLDDGGNKNWGLLFFDKKLQDAYKSWMKQMFTEKNPYTGIPLCDDASLAVIQIQNEDSLLFYTAQNIKGAAKKELRRMFGDFLKKKYASLEKAKEAWNNATLPMERWASASSGN